MRFRQLDQILELQPGKRIVAVKRLEPDEEYLKDHFPGFPVMPGVLMLEAMFQAGAWLVYASEDFQHALVVLKEARNVKFADFVEPGEQLVVTAEMLGQEGPLVKLKAQGVVGDSVAVSGRLVLNRSNEGDREPSRAMTDTLSVHELRRLFRQLAPRASCEGHSHH
jgi:3-hydroxyacyl-[acyl-carrier-protein] dehydratase